MKDTPTVATPHTPHTPDTPAPARARTRTRNPYTAREREQLIRWHAAASKTRSNSGPGPRRAGNRFAQLVAAKKAEGYTWRELAEPLGIKPRTLNAFLSRRLGQRPEELPDGVVPLIRLEPSRARYGEREVVAARSETFFACGVHRITPENSYPPTHPGGSPRDKWCERAKRRARYAAAKAALEKETL